MSYNIVIVEILWLICITKEDSFVLQKKISTCSFYSDIIEFTKEDNDISSYNSLAADNILY